MKAGTSSQILLFPFQGKEHGPAMKEGMGLVLFTTSYLLKEEPPFLLPSIETEKRQFWKDMGKRSLGQWTYFFTEFSCLDSPE
jgi:hypothetical protein